MEKKLIVTLSGAGLSAESGIPTFRDSKNGLWHNHKVEEVADHDAWYQKKNKELMLEFYSDRWNNVKVVEPNTAHKAIAKLQEKYNIINITQNVDNLLERAGCENVWHLHGCLDWRKCEWHNSITNLDGDNNFKCTYRTINEEPAHIGEICPLCGTGQMRPDVVWFGEAVDLRGAYVENLARMADIFICIGTSAQVHPAAGMLFTFKNVKEKYFIDLDPPLRLHSFTKLKGLAGEHMAKLADELLNRN